MRLTVVTLLLTTLAGTASAQTCPQVRPTDPSGGLIHYDDPGSVAFVDDPKGRVRVWYATAGPHLGSASDAMLVGSVVDEALDGFAALGFAPPRGDGDYPACASNGGDGRLDVYLVAFPSSADGSAGIDRCESGPSVTCSGFILLDHELAGYSSYEAGVRTVAPHELFHLVQDAYDADLDRWWAEGTAQWAADRLAPELDDLESFLPAFFADPGRPLDAPPGGVTASWLYGTAIWPRYLDETLGPEAVLAVHAALAEGSSPVLEATEAVLSAEGRSLADAFLEFAAFNAATGERAQPGQGYAAASDYPMVAVADLPGGLGELHGDLLAGLSAHYYVSHEARRLVLEGDPEGVAAIALPFDGVVDLEARVRLPADLAGPALVVVAGQRRSKIDAPYTLVAEALPPPPPVEPPPSSPPPAETSSCQMAPSGGDPAMVALWLASLIGLGRRLPSRRSARRHLDGKSPDRLSRERASEPMHPRRRGASTRMAQRAPRARGVRPHRPHETTAFVVRVGDGR